MSCSLNMPRKILYFEGAGARFSDASKDAIIRCRIRTAFHLDDGRAVYLEIVGSDRKGTPPHNYPEWRYTGFVVACFEITDEDPNEDERKYSFRDPCRNMTVRYKNLDILEFVNGLEASFDAIQVLPALGGYKVFPMCQTCKGLERFNYGDEFVFDPEMLMKREAVYSFVYNLELAERKKDRSTGEGRFVHPSAGADYPDFSLWVDEEDHNVLHLLRQFNGYQKHWTLRTDMGDTLSDWISTMEESSLIRSRC